MQETPFCACCERAKLLCSAPYWWQPRQRALMSAAEAFLKAKILVLSPPPSTCALPGPWQASQPCHSGPFLVSSVVTKWGEFSYVLKKPSLGMFSWQVLHVSVPT